MDTSKGGAQARRRWFERLFPALGALDAPATAETLEILMDVEQVSDLFASMEDVRAGRIVGMDQAFGDL